MAYLKGVLARLMLWPVCAIGALIAVAWMLPLVFSTGPRFIRIAVGIDNADSACFGGNGYTTISRRAFLAMKSGRRWGCVLCKLLDLIQKDHCENA